MAGRNGGYTGGAFDATIPDSYAYEDYKADFNACSPFVMCMLADDDDEFANTLALLMTENVQMMEAFGRMTAYIERNGLNEIYR